jgi:hypothetical protein
MERIANNLARLSLERKLDPVYLDELDAAAQDGDEQRFLDGVSYLLAALGEARGS